MAVPQYLPDDADPQAVYDETSGNTIPDFTVTIFPELEGLPASSTVPAIRAAARQRVRCPDCRAPMQRAHLKYRHVCKTSLNARANELLEQGRKRFHERTGTELPDLPFRSK